MSEETSEILRREGERDARLAFLEERTAELHGEFECVAKLLRGNGDGGLFAQVELCRERIESLQSQWRWILGLFTALALGLAQVLLRK